jgi:hypothetical protein
MNFRFTAAVFCGLCLLLGACRRDYPTVVARELASGVRHDDLFFGMYFGMARDSFYRHCWQLNRQGLVTNGPRNTTVLYLLDDCELPIEMNFYPAFAGGKIFRMDVTFNYQSWAPWNRQLFSDKLLPEALAALQTWYPGRFEKYKTAEGRPYWASVSGNRAIHVTLADERDVRAEIRDLTVAAPVDPPPSAQEIRPLWEKRGSQ